MREDADGFIDWVQEERPNEEPVADPGTPLTDADFELLNQLEDLEARRIRLGVFESWSSLNELASGCSQPEVAERLARLVAHGFVLRTAEGALRSRIAEIAREIRYVKQRFGTGDANRRPYLVRSLKLEVKPRDKPQRNVSLAHLLSDLKSDLEAVPHAGVVLDGLGSMLRTHWNDDSPSLAAFQGRALRSILRSWTGVAPQSDTFVITADTGSGKTEAACLPLIAGAAIDALQRPDRKGTSAVFVYPRVRLAANQAQRLVAYLAALGKVEGLPTLTIGIQNYQVPSTFDRAHRWWDDDSLALWEAGDPSRWGFPFFKCPSTGCEAPLQIRPGEGHKGADLLRCTGCPWQFAGWIGSKRGLVARPPDLFLPVTESLHHWLHRAHYNPLFGDESDIEPPKAILADEIHLYSHVHGAQVGYALRRLLARAELNGQRALAIGMSATLGDAAGMWGDLVGRHGVVTIEPNPDPAAGERVVNPRAREYFLFVQPEVESRGRDIAGASTTIQSLMCAAHSMRRRPARKGGFRGIVFLNSIDKLKRLHADYSDAEQHGRLAQYRTYLYDDNAQTGEPRHECCDEPMACDAFRSGECWHFAATDDAQWTANGRYSPKGCLRVCERPVFSGNKKRVEDMIAESDLVFATSSLEVGYDDPAISLVWQHYAPSNVASFVQRKGRGGRGEDDRPITGVTLSVYSPRGTWFFRQPQALLDPSDFVVPLNMENTFVRRGQMLATLLDALAHLGTSAWKVETPGGVPVLSPQTQSVCESHIARVLGSGAIAALGFADLTEFWEAAWSVKQEPVPVDPYGWSDALPWVPAALFRSRALPVVEVRADEQWGTETRPAVHSEEIGLASNLAAPGNITRRWGSWTLHWIPPTDGRAPLIARADYETADWIDMGSGAEILGLLPIADRPDLGEVHPRIVTPRVWRQEVAGTMRGTGWTARWGYDAGKNTIVPAAQLGQGDPLVHHKSRGFLRGFTTVRARTEECSSRGVDSVGKLVAEIRIYMATGDRGDRTGLEALRLYWAAESQIRLDDPQVDDLEVKQVFSHPDCITETLVHGYRLETEGLQLVLDSDRIDRFLEADLARLQSPENAAELRRIQCQLLGFGIEAGCKASGLDGFRSRRLGQTLVTATSDPDLRSRLRSKVKRWDGQGVCEILLEAFDSYLQHHPALTRNRVEGLREALADTEVQRAVQRAVRESRSDNSLRAWLRSALLHSLAIRLRHLVVIVGRAEERGVLVHARLPLQFGEEADDTLTVFENAEFGDGTTRAVLAELDAALGSWTSGALALCPNAAEDALLMRLLAAEERHAAWLLLDPNSPSDLEQLAQELGAGDLSLQRVARVLFETSTVGSLSIRTFDFVREVEEVRSALCERLGRLPRPWELVGAAVRCAEGDGLLEAATLSRLLEGYAAVDGEQIESFSPSARLADQIHRLDLRLCHDGCPACLYVSSPLMSDSQTAQSVSRRLLARFVEYLGWEDCS